MTHLGVVALFSSNFQNFKNKENKYNLTLSIEIKQIQFNLKHRNVTFLIQSPFFRGLYLQ
jgi:hypothetical protein